MRPGEREWLEREAFEANGFAANIAVARGQPTTGHARQIAGRIANPGARIGPESAADLKLGVDQAPCARPDEAADASFCREL